MYEAGEVMQAICPDPRSIIAGRNIRVI